MTKANINKTKTKTKTKTKLNTNIKHQLTSMLMLLVLMVLLTTSSNVQSKAFCALRDPVSQIYHFFPLADNYRSIVRSVNESTRQQVLEQLPNYRLHNDELGRHTLYVALKNQRPIGIVHVRSEQSQWGLIEVAWALDLQLNVLDFNFQRSRAVGNQVVQTEQFKRLIIGKNFTQLSQYLDQAGKLNNDDFIAAAQGAKSLARVVLVNGLKTLLVTQFAWATEIEQLTTTQGDE